MNNILKKLSAARLVLMTLLMGSAASASAADQVYISDFGIKAGEVKEIAINFDTDATDIQYLEGNIQLPAGLVLVNDAYGKNRRVKGESTRNADSNGNMNPETGDFIVTSTGAFTGTEGAVAYITVGNNRYLKEISQIKLSGLKAVKADGTKVPVADFTTTVTRTTALAWLAYVKDTLAMVGGEVADVEVEMTNVVDVTLLQARLSVEKGLKIKEVKASGRASGVQYNPENGIVIVNIKKDQPLEEREDVAGAKGVLFTIKVVADKGFMGKSKVHVSEPIASDDEAVTHKPKAIALDVTIRDAELKAKCDSIAKAASEQLEAALKHIAERDTDVVEKYEKELMPIGQQLVQLQRNIETAYQDLTLKEKDVKDAADKIAAAIKALRDAADAEQKQIEAERAKKAANDAAYKKLSDELAALQAQLDAAKAAIAEGDKDVAKDFEDELAAIQKQIDDAKKALEDKNAKTELTADSKLEGVDGVPAAIEKAKADADAAQKAYEEEQAAEAAKKAANEANYQAIKAIFEAAQQQLDAAKQHIAERDTDVVDDFAARLQELQNTLNTGSAVIDSLYKAVALAEVDSSQFGHLDDFTAALEQLVKDADAAQLKIEEERAAEAAKKAENQANYDKIKPVFDEAQALLDATKKHIEENCADVAKDFAERLQKLQDDLNTGRAIVDSLYKAVALVGIDSVGYADEFVKDVEQLKADADAAQQAWIIAHQKIFEEGVYYLQNVATGKFLAAGHDWGTRAIVSEEGLDFTAAFTPEGKYTFDSKVSNGGNSHFLGSNLYTDAAAFGWTVAEVSKGVYTLSNGQQFAAVNAEDNLDWAAEANDSAQWKLVTYAERVKALEDARTANPLNATFLIQDANFGRNDQRKDFWTISEDCTNKNMSGGAYENMCAESWHSVFTISQTIENVPNGIYELTAQGFWRQDGEDTENIPVFFANGMETQFPVKAGEENSMNDASASFTQGLYTIEPMTFEVTDGTITLGTKNANLTVWAIWDNFRLTFKGPEQVVADDVYYLQHVATGKYLAAGHSWGTQAIVNEDGLDFTLKMANDGKYTLDSKVANNANNHFLGDNLYTDSPAFGWTISQVRDGSFTLGNGEKNVTIDENGNAAWSEENDESVVWKFVTYAERVKELEGATKAAPKNATFLIQDANFGRNDQRKEFWTISEDCTNKNMSGGANENMCAESWHSVFTISQKIENVPNGIYEMTVQGFWRQDGEDTENIPVFFVNDKETQFPLKQGTENSMNDASASFTQGLYTIEPMTFEVADGTITLGTKNANLTVWAIWDNFRLTYLGVATNPDDPELEAPTGWIKAIANGNLAGDNLSSFVSKEAPSADIVPARIVEGAGKNNSRGIVVKSADNPAQGWDTQFWIVLNDALTTDTKLHVEFDYKANKSTAAVGTQTHLAPGNYKHWAAIGNVTFTEEWQHFSADVTIDGNMDGLTSIAFNLADEKTATEFYFDNFGVWYQKPTVEPKWKDVIVNGNMEGTDVSMFFKTEQGVGGPMPAEITDGIGKDGGRAIKVQSADDPAQNWDTQFFIRLPYQLPAGTKYKVEFDYKADKEGGFETQAHTEPGGYIHWDMIGGGTFTTEWQHFEKQGTITSDQSKEGQLMQTIAFNLALNKVATGFIFDNIKFFLDEEFIKTGIRNVNATPMLNDGAIYDLRGQKVDGTLRKGIYIQNGRKIMVK